MTERNQRSSSRIRQGCVHINETGADDQTLEAVMTIHPIIRQIIDRDCHVGETNRKVIRHVISKLANGYRTFKSMPKEDRRLFIGQCVRHHRYNLKAYVEVMSGFSVTIPDEG